MAKPTYMPIAKQAKAPKTAANTKCFSLVPATAQQQMYKTIAALRAVIFSGARGTEIAEVAICLALGQQDPVIVCHNARGARAVRKDCIFANSKRIDGRFAAATISAVTALIDDSKTTALVCVGPLQAEDDYRRAFSFAARHKLPVLYLVANSLTPGRRQALDLRTLYADFGIPEFSVEANDAIAAYRVATEALHNARHGRGPCVIEALTLDGNGVNKEDSLRLLRTYMERHDNWPL
jgi:TPP-dependent pyruvate/acetoin dehydrogenase alpha subunit